MQVTVTFRQMEPSEGVRRYALEKVERLQKFLRRPIEAHLVFAVAKRLHTAEVLITGKDLNLAAKAETSDLYAAVDLVIDKIERQLIRKTAKRKNHRATDPLLLPLATVEPPLSATIVRQTVAIKALSIKQALGRLRQSKNDFLLFESTETDALALLYRRGDGRIALVEPEA